MRTEIKNIGPKEAEELLRINSANRIVNEARVVRYANDMGCGNWMMNGEPIIVGKSRLLDGQHRLHAVIKSGLTVPMLVVSEVEDTAFMTIDTGRDRIAGDVFSIAGVKNSRTAAAAVLRALEYEHSVGKYYVRGSHIPFQCTQGKLLEVYRSDEQAWEEALTTGMGVYRNFPFINQSMAVGMSYLFAKVSKPKCEAFMRQVGTGENISAGDPAYALRDAMIKRRESKYKEDARTTMIKLCYAWNAYRQGRKLNIVRYNQEQPVPDFK